METSLRIVKAKPAYAKDLAIILSQASTYKEKHHDFAWRGSFTEADAQELIKAGHTYTVFLGEEAVATLGLHWEDKLVWGESRQTPAISTS